MRKFNKDSVIGVLASILLLSGLISPVSVFAANQATVNLGTAGNFTILAQSGITTTGTTKILGDIGVSPIAATAITGFGLKFDLSKKFSTSTLVTGKIYAASYATPTPSMLATAVLDMQTAYNNIAGLKNPTKTELGSGNIGGLTIAPGLYKWSSNVAITKDLTLSGDKNAIWIFQIAGTLNVSPNKKIILSGGAQAKNVFWQVSGKTMIDTYATFNGIILDKTAIVLNTGAKLNGKALAQTAVTLQFNTIESNEVKFVTLSVSTSSVAIDSATSTVVSKKWYQKIPSFISRLF